MTATTTQSQSLPNTRSSSPAHHVGGSASGYSTPPLPPSGAVPTDFRTSLAAWWNNTSYKEARIAEERLLRRMAHFQPPSPPSQATEKGWFGWSAGSSSGGSNGNGNEKVDSPIDSSNPGHGSTSTSTDAEVAMANQRQGEEVSQPIPIEGTKLVATLRNVFIPTPNPLSAPQHPADPIIEPSEADSPPASASSSTASLDKKCKTDPLHRRSVQSGRRKDGKMVDYINTLEISRPEDREVKEAVVVLHGYAAALGFFFRNWDAIASHSASTGRRTFFLDWLGMGLSSRPSPTLLSSPASSPIPARVARAEHFFLSSLESWRQSVGLDRMVLVGHSLGGYLASAYAVRYPERVSGLILVSPAGIPHGKEYTRYETTAEQERLRAKGQAKRESKVDPDVQQRGDLDEAADAAEEELSGGSPNHEPKGEAKQWNKDQTMMRRNMMKFFVWGWEKGISPFTFLRTMGPFGPMFAGRYSLRRFSAQSDEDVRDLHGYIYNTSVLKGSGEFCISHILAPGAYARVPILDRIAAVKVPVTFLYGDIDWMDVDGGHASVAALKKAGNEKASVHVVKKAGHHVYLDNPEDTNRIIGEAIKAIPKK